MSTRITAAVLNTAPGPLELEELLIDDPGPDEVLVKVAYAGLCHSDLHEIDGTFETQPPIVLGHEAVGRVVATGASVSEFAPGDTVVTCLSAYCGNCEYCVAGRQTLCVNRARLQQERSRPRLTKPDGRPVRPTAGIGAFAEMILVHKNSLVTIPDDVRPETASVLGCAVTTGMGAVLHSASVQTGQSVAVVGLGGVGFAAVQAARLAGAAQVIGIDVVPGKLERAVRFGATHVVDARETDPVAAVREITGTGVHHAFEAVGSAATAGQAFAMLRPGGTATVMGMIPDSQPIPVRGAELFLEEKRIQGSFMGSNHFKVDVPLYVHFNRMGLLQLDDLVTARCDLATLNDGFKALASGREIRVVARVGEV
ncbi:MULTISPECIES: Zn-dependent alcohol dehydrogenase [Streptomyces]|uniref:S-(Hydroxymethyl)glutathione dehydrogenase/alcohol dehydrogenase n=1 Tax=Streptomyces nymphaeiformis TaxID=2663842 RepID=A0A7W7TZ63_9ACTN|nr:Zn-dependent alcohol dehydrogenase [Streptomyces nymphaeiformis]MBB4981671.1 S-(hydroxymethyl)glutathione dehydrogenase/alcohol dehydrogenase [Streptomyces nymphaeiformis]